MKVFCFTALLLYLFPSTDKPLSSLYKTNSAQLQYLQKISLTGHAQGTTWHVTYYFSDSIVQHRQIDSILDKIDSSMSLYKSYSLINRFNNSSSGGIMDDHLSRVMRKSLDTYRRTDGLFDVTVQPLVEAWGFSAKKVLRYPDSATIRSLLGCIGSGALSVRRERLIKKRPCIKIDLDGIAQGYTVDVLANYLETNGVRDYLVEVGGEIRVKGRNPLENRPWTVGIEAPGDGAGPELMQRILVMDAGGITTSGNYRIFHESHGRKFSHIIDPRTGFPSQNELISVTVFSENALTADAYDNALMIMGLKKAMQFVEKRKDLSAYFIYKKQDGSIADTASSRFAVLFKNDSLNSER